MIKTKEPGLFVISTHNPIVDANNPDKIIVKRQIEMSLKTPRQVMRVKTFKVLFQAVEAPAPGWAVVHRDLWIELPFVSYNHCVDNTSNSTSFSMTLSDKELTHTINSNEPLYMSTDAQQNFVMTIRNADGEIAKGILQFYLSFETELGSL